MYPIFNLNFGKINFISSIFIILSWNLVYSILVGCKKKSGAGIFNFAFFAILRCSENAKSPILAKNGHFRAFWPGKTAKNEKMKNSRITFFLSLTWMLYTKFQSNKIICADLMLTFVENQKPIFVGFSAKFGKILTKNAHLRPKYSKYPNSDWIFGYKPISCT